MKRTLVLSAALAGLVLVAASAAAPRSQALVIRHQLHGCHSWSLNGGTWKTAQAVHLARGGSIVVTNNDVMYHRLVKVSGPSVAFKLVHSGMPMRGTTKPPWAPGMMGRPGASVRVTFPSHGVYRLVTRFGEDYMPMGETIGEDNNLSLVVTVS